jgi:hypothetical protein
MEYAYFFENWILMKRVRRCRVFDKKTHQDKILNIFLYVFAQFKSTESCMPRSTQEIKEDIDQNFIYKRNIGSVARWKEYCDILIQEENLSDKRLNVFPNIGAGQFNMGVGVGRPEAERAMLCAEIIKYTHELGLGINVIFIQGAGSELPFQPNPARDPEQSGDGQTHSYMSFAPGVELLAMFSGDVGKPTTAAGAAILAEAQRLGISSAEYQIAEVKLHRNQGIGMQTEIYVNLHFNRAKMYAASNPPEIQPGGLQARVAFLSFLGDQVTNGPLPVIFGGELNIEGREFREGPYASALGAAVPQGVLYQDEGSTWNAICDKYYPHLYTATPFVIDAMFHSIGQHQENLRGPSFYSCSGTTFEEKNAIDNFRCTLYSYFTVDPKNHLNSTNKEDLAGASSRFKNAINGFLQTHKVEITSAFRQEIPDIERLFAVIEEKAPAPAPAPKCDSSSDEEEKVFAPTPKCGSSSDED